MTNWAPFLTGSPTPGTNRIVEKRWLGQIRKKPWDYNVTATMAHLETPEILEVNIKLLRLQTEVPYIVIVDTGSSLETCERIEKLRADDCEIHYIRAHSYQHPSAPVSVACDLAQALAVTPYIYWTHTDCFLVNRCHLGIMMGLCNANHPAVGYRLSPRTDEPNWKRMLGHTSLMTHKPTFNRLGITWSVERAHDQFEVPRKGDKTGGYPDTETCMNYLLRENGIEPHFVGEDTNYERFTDDNIDHFRSFGGAKLYSDHRGGHLDKANIWMKEAIADANSRIAEWTKKA